MKSAVRLCALATLLMVAATPLFAEGQEEQAAEEQLTISSMIPFTARGTTLAPDSWVELFLEERYDVNLEPWYDIDAYDGEARKREDRGRRHPRLPVGLGTETRPGSMRASSGRSRRT